MTPQMQESCLNKFYAHECSLIKQLATLAGNLIFARTPINTSHPAFRRALKTHLFRLAFDY